MHRVAAEDTANVQVANMLADLSDGEPDEADPSTTAGAPGNCGARKVRALRLTFLLCPGAPVHLLQEQLTILITLSPCQSSILCTRVYSEVWTYARPTEFYTKIYREVMSILPGGTLLVVQTSGSPNAYLAALQLGVTEVKVLVDRPPAHQIFHGDLVTRDYFLQSALTTHGVQLPTVPVPTLQTHLQLISAQVPDAPAHVLSVIDPWDVPSKVDSDPYAGLDLVHKNITPFADLVMSEARANRLTVEASRAHPSSVGVFTTTRLLDGACFPLPCLVFSTQPFVKQFLRKHGKYSDRVVVCTGVQRHGEECPLFAVLLGFAGEIIHSPVPNTELQVHPVTGFNYGFLTLTVKTKNKVGVAPGQDL